MATQMTSTTQVDPAVAAYYNRVLLRQMYPKYIHDLAAEHYAMPQKSGTIMKWRRYNKLPSAQTPLPEGVTPLANVWGKMDLLVTVQPYGAYVILTDVVDYTVEDPTLNKLADEQGEQMGLTMDSIVRDVLYATASYVACSGGGNGQTPTEIAATDCATAAQTLISADCEMISKARPGSVKIGTVPVRQAFFAIGHTDMIPALDAIASPPMVNAANYPNPVDIHPAEWATVGNLRFFLSTNAKKVGSAPSIYTNFIIGKYAYGVVDMEGGLLEHIVKPFDAPDKSDPLNQISTSGWKVLGFAARILNDSLMLGLYATNKAHT